MVIRREVDKTEHLRLQGSNTFQHQVTEKTDSIYTIEGLVSSRKITTQVHNLCLFIYDPDRTSPHTVAQHNEQEFVKESVLAHRGDHNRRSTLEFHIR